VIAEFEREGYAVRRGMVPAEELALLRSIHSRWFALKDKLLVEQDERGRVMLERVRDIGSDSPEIFDTSFWLEGCAIATRLLEGDRLHAIVSLESRPPGAPPSPLRQRAGVRRPEVTRDVIVWVPLEDCRGENAYLAVVPRSHDRIHGHDRAGRPHLMPWPVAERIPLAAGDAVFLHEGLVYGAEANETGQPRAAISLYAWLPTLLAA
jgi:hypothetical protein